VVRPVLRPVLRAGVVGMLGLSGWVGASPAWADSLWIQPGARTSTSTGISKGVVALVYAGSPQDKTALPILDGTAALSADGKPLVVSVQGDHLEVAAQATATAATADLRVTARQATADGVLVYHQARLGRWGTKAVNDLELVPTEAGGNTFRLVFKGQPVAANLVNVSTSSGWRRALRPNDDGSLTLDTPFAGLYVLEVSARVNGGATTIDGVAYTTLQYTATLSFEVTP